MKGKYIVISALAILLGFIVVRMMKFEESLRMKRVVEVIVEDANKPLLEAIPREDLEKIASKADYYAMIDGDYFKVLTKVFEEEKVNKWETVFIKGVNLGVAMPGKFPSEFSLDFDGYLQYLRWIGEMNSNVIRLYTILPPAFYEAFAYYNMHYQNRKLFLLQGVWIEEPPKHYYFDRDFTRNFEKEISHVIDAIHGNSVLKPRPGSADGVYVYDISENVLGIILGREWEPKAVKFTNQRDTIRNFTGNFISVSNASPMEIWLGQILDFTVQYETQKYSSQRPVSFVNWLPLDPMYHSFEYIESEEINEFDNDLESIDFMKFNATELFQPGIFASYHVYPYYPDYIYLDKKYNDQGNKGESDNYFAYLQDLKKHHPQIPLLIAEYGIPSSRGNSHYTPFGYHQGGHSEKDQASISRTLTSDIQKSGCAGAIYFEWIDEWFKFNWLVMDFEQPQERRKYWHSLENPEQNFGIIAIESKNKIIDGKLDDWGKHDTSAQQFIYFDSDAAYFYLCAKINDLDLKKQHLYFAIDTYDEKKGDHKLPFSDELFEKGFEFLIQILSPDSAKTLVDDPYNIFTDATRNIRPVYASKENNNGYFVDQTLLANRARYSLIGDSSAIVIHNRSIMKKGNSSVDSTSNANWFWNEKEHVIEIRLTWPMLNVGDPSGRYVLDDLKGTRQIESSTTPGFNIRFFLTDNRDNILPSSMSGKYYFYTWEPWEEPVYQVRKKPLYYTLQNCFDKLEPLDTNFFQNNINEDQFRFTAFYNNNEAAISVIFDHACYSQYQYALPVLKLYHIKATFGAVFDWLDQGLTSVSNEISLSMKRISISDFITLAYNGHEIALQSLASDSVKEKSQKSFMMKSQKKGLEKLLNVPVFIVLGNHVKDNTDPIVLKEAGFLYTLQDASGVQILSDIKLNDLRSSLIINNKDTDLKKFEILLEESIGNWTIINYRHVLPENTREYKLLTEEQQASSYLISPSLFERHIRLVRNTSYWIAPLSEVGAYLTQKDHSEIKTIRHERFIFFTVVSKLNTEVFNHPLTVEYLTANRKIRVSNSASDGIYDIRDGSVLLNVFPNREITIEILE